MPSISLRFGVFAILGLALAAHAAPRSDPAATNQSQSADFEGSRSEVYRHVGGVDLAVHIFAPPGHVSTDRSAAILFFFGGGWANGSASQFVPQCKHLAARGMVAIAADYRVYSRNQAMIADCVADAQTAMRWVRSHAKDLGIDADRIAAAGGSAGGHLAAATAMLDDFTCDPQATVSFRPNALVLFNPAVDLRSTISVSGRPKVNTLKIANRMGAKAENLSPAAHVRAGLPPTIIFHGMSDTLVPFSSLEDFTKAMKAAGNDCKLVGFRGRKHGFFNFGRNENRYYHETLSQAECFLASLGYLKADRASDYNEYRKPASRPETSASQPR